MSAWLLPLSLLLTAAVVVLAVGLLLRGQRLLRRVRDTEARYQVFYELAPVAMVVHDQQHRIIDWNRAAERLFGWAREEALGRDFFELLGPGGGLPELRHAVDETLKTTVRSSTMNWSQGADGRKLLCDWSNAVIKDAGGQVSAVVSMAHDVTATREFERRLRSSERRFRSLAENAWDVIWTAGLDGQVTYASPSVERMLGYSPETVRQGRIFDVLAPEVAGQLRKALEELRTRGTLPPRQWEVEQRTRDGRAVWAQVTMEVLRGDNGAPREILGITRDITEQRAVQARLTELAHSDPLTGLPNRRLFFDRLEERVRLARRQERPLALLFLDLDGFKTVNDRHGHAIGDEVLKIVATRFSAALRESDSLSRVAGDEFTVLLGPSSEPLDPQEVSGRLLDALRAPVSCQGVECRLGVSIGIAFFPADAQEPDALLRCADQAMYLAKRRGRNRFEVYAPAATERLPASAAGS